MHPPLQPISPSTGVPGSFDIVVDKCRYAIQQQYWKYTWMLSLAISISVLTSLFYMKTVASKCAECKIFPNLWKLGTNHIIPNISLLEKYCEYFLFLRRQHITAWGTSWHKYKYMHSRDMKVWVSTSMNHAIMVRLTTDLTYVPMEVSISCGMIKMVSDEVHHHPADA